MVDKLFFVVLILNTTGLFAFIAPQTGVTIGIVSSGLLIFNILYLIAKTRYSAIVLSNRVIWIWIIVLLIWPLLTLLYAPSFELRQIGLQFYYVTLFIGTIVYTIANGLLAMYRVMAISIVITLFGLALSMIAPHVFSAVSELANANVMIETRATGFLLQPNSLAITLSLLFIGWFALWKRKNTAAEAAIILLFIVAMLLTGSRVGILVAVAIVVLINVSRLWRDVGNVRSWIVLLNLCFYLSIGLLVAKHFASQMDSVFGDDLSNRMEQVLNFQLTDKQTLSDDASIAARLAAQNVYWSLIDHNQLLGHGFGSDVYYKEAGLIIQSAHSDALLFAMEYGILYSITIVVLMIFLLIKRERYYIEHILQTGSVSQFVMVVLFLFLFSGSVFDNRGFYVVWGMLFTSVYFYRYFYNQHQLFRSNASVAKSL